MPITYNPIRRSRDDFMGEQSSQFFPSVDQGRTGLSPYVEGGYAASSRLAMDDLLAKRDEQNTQLAENYTRRLQAENRARLMPFTAAAEIAAAKFHARKSGLDEEISPFLAEEDKARAQLNTDRYTADRENLPAKSLLEGLQAEDAAANWEPSDPDKYQAKLLSVTKNPRDLINYDDIYEESDKAMPKSERRKLAYYKAMALMEDREAVSAIESMLADDPQYMNKRKALVVDEISPKTGRVRGSYINPNADIAEVNRMVRQYNSRKFDLQKSNAEKRFALGDQSLEYKALSKMADTTWGPERDLILAKMKFHAGLAEIDPAVVAENAKALGISIEEAQAKAEADAVIAAKAAAVAKTAATPPPPAPKEEPKKEDPKASPVKSDISNYLDSIKKK